MDEVDSVIIHQLQEIGCFFEDDYQSLKQFSSQDVVQSLAKIITQIDPEVGGQLNLTGNLNMASKFQLATQFSQICADLGFRGDLGYHTFLYCNDADIRKVMLFLLEKMPKDELQSGVTTEASIETQFDKLKKLPVSTIWLPPMSTKGNTADIYWNTLPLDLMLDSKSILESTNQKHQRNYYDNYANIPLNLSSLIEWNSIQRIKPDLKGVSFTIETKPKIMKKPKFKEREIRAQNLVASAEGTESTSGSVFEDSEAVKKQAMQERLSQLEETLTSQTEELRGHKTTVSEQMVQIDVLNKQLAQETTNLVNMESSDKSMDELKAEVHNAKCKLLEFEEEWNSINDRLVNQLKNLEETKSEQINRKAELSKEMIYLKETISNISREISTKDAAIETLSEDLNRKSLPPNRAFYTRRIIDIVNNVKKQNQETRKILTETRGLRKDITSLTEKVKRAYTITDELIFKEAKSSEWNRKCYKLLAELHKTYDCLQDDVESIGLIKREILQTEESVENEKQNKVSANLARIQADLRTIVDENNTLINEMQRKSDAKQQQQQ